MAVQFHVAHSSQISGAGIIAGGPFYCAQANVELALTSCMTSPELISVDELVAFTKTTYVTTQSIDNPENLSKDTAVWLFTGTEDTVVNPGVVRKLEAYYGNLGVPNIKIIDTIAAEHSWPTVGFGNACDFKGEPYMNKCDFDAATQILSFLHPSSSSNNTADTEDTNSTAISGQFHEIDQSKFTPPLVIPAAVGLGDTAYAFVPDGCTLGRGGCHVHVAFHGCLQSIGKIGLDFVNHTGLNDYASTNGIIVLYPQAVPTLDNPKGCWDWWGYTGVDYASQLGVQMATVKAMLDSILAPI